MKNSFGSSTRRIIGGFALMLCAATVHAQQIQISDSVLLSKIKGCWIGKTAGVCIGASHECRYNDGAPDNTAIDFNPNLGEGFYQDDIYVQMTFLGVMDTTLSAGKSIYAATMKNYGAAFGKTAYPLYHANESGRSNIRNNILPPFSGMWAGSGHQYNPHARCIDFQIECDWIGVMCPGMPKTAQIICDTVGPVTGYGGGKYGGYFVATCEALAFKYTDIRTIITEALKNIPPQSEYYKIIKDVVDYHDNNPASTWQNCLNYIQITKNWMQTSWSCPDPCNVSAADNGALTTIALLYGGLDYQKTIEIAVRCGQDSDCNPASAGAILGTMNGYEAAPAQWRTTFTSILGQNYQDSKYTTNLLISSSVNRAKKCILENGGTYANGVYSIITQAPSLPPSYEEWGKEPVKLEVSAVPEQHRKTINLKSEISITRDSRDSYRIIGTIGSADMISISDYQGRSVRTVPAISMSDGTIAAQWNGTDTRGVRVRSGNYIVTARCSGKAVVTRSLLIR